MAVDCSFDPFPGIRQALPSTDSSYYVRAALANWQGSDGSGDVDCSEDLSDWDGAHCSGDCDGLHNVIAA